jgi:asparagine N-glycosylation enzyme membrane subunit Stt3
VYKVFEVVPGALVVGQAAPGELVGVRLGVFTNRGRKFVYQTHGVADAAGEYRVRVPYATDGGPHGIRTGPFYRVSCGTELGGVAVPEQAVIEGRTVVGPPLCRDDHGPGE